MPLLLGAFPFAFEPASVRVHLHRYVQPGAV